MSNKTPKVADAKTVLVRRLKVPDVQNLFLKIQKLRSQNFLSAAAKPFSRGFEHQTQRTSSFQARIFWLALAFAVGLFFYYSMNTNTTNCLRKFTDGECIAKLEVVNDEASRARGLSGRESLDAGSGMLFVFDTADIYCFWMKGMKFDIDMIWLDGDKNAVKIEPNVSKDSYPQQFCPSSLAKYVIELNSGEASKNSILVSQKLNF